MNDKYIDEEELEWEENNKLLREGTRDQIDALKNSWKEGQLKWKGKEVYDDNDIITLKDIESAFSEISSDFKEKKSVYQKLKYSQDVKSFLIRIGIDISLYNLDLDVLGTFKKLHDGSYWSDTVYQKIKAVYLVLYKLYLKNDYRPLTDILLVVDECIKLCKIVRKDIIDIIELLGAYKFLICKQESLTLTRFRLIAISLLNTNLKNGKMVKEERLTCGVKAVFSLWNEYAETNNYMHRHKLLSSNKLYKDVKKCLDLLFTGRMGHYRYDVDWLHKFNECNRLLKRKWFIEDILNTLQNVMLCYQKGYAPVRKKEVLPKSLINVFYDKYLRISLFLKVEAYGVDKIDDELGQWNKKGVTRSQIIYGVNVFKGVFYGYARQYKKYYENDEYELLKQIITYICIDYKRFYNLDDVRVREIFQIEFRIPSFFIDWFIKQLRFSYMEPELNIKKMIDDYYLLVIEKLEDFLGIKKDVLSMKSYFRQYWREKAQKIDIDSIFE